MPRKQINNTIYGSQRRWCKHNKAQHKFGYQREQSKRHTVQIKVSKAKKKAKTPIRYKEGLSKA